MSLRAKRSEVKQSQGLWELYTLLHSKVYLRLPTYYRPIYLMYRSESLVYSSKRIQLYLQN